MGQDAQTEFPILAVVASGSQGRSQVAFEHAEDGFNLPPLAIGFLGESVFHQGTIPAGHGTRLTILSGPTPIRRRDDTADAVPFAAEPMESFGLVTRIAEQGPKRLMSQSLVKRLPGLDRVDPGAAINHHPEDQMIGRITDRRELRIAMLIVGGMALAPLRVVGRDVAGLQARRVDRRLAGTSGQKPGLAAMLEHGVEHRRRFVLAQQTLVGGAESGKVWYLAQIQNATQI